MISKSFLWFFIFFIFSTCKPKISSRISRALTCSNLISESFPLLPEQVCAPGFNNVSLGQDDLPIL